MVRCRAPALPPNPHTSPPHDLQGDFVISLSQERAKNTVVGGLDVVVGTNDRFLRPDADATSWCQLSAPAPPRNLGHLEPDPTLTSKCAYELRLAQERARYAVVGGDLKWWLASYDMMHAAQHGADGPLPRVGPSPPQCHHQHTLRQKM